MAKHNNPTTVGALLRNSTKPTSTNVASLTPATNNVATKFKFKLTADDLASYLLTAYRYEVSSRGKQYIDSDETVKAIIAIADCLTNPHEKCGLMFSGNVGNGKSTMMRALQRTFNWLRSSGLASENTGMRIFQAKDIASDMQWPDDFDTIRRYTGIALDDLGVEPNEEIIFGNVRTPVIDLLEYRYQNQLFTVVTTNLTKEQRKAKYGERIYDRFREMFFNIVFKGESYR